MKKIDELQEKKQELKKRISFLLQNFYDENGCCEISIKNIYHYDLLPNGEKRLIGIDLNVDIQI